METIFEFHESFTSLNEDYDNDIYIWLCEVEERLCVEKSHSARKL